ECCGPRAGWTGDAPKRSSVLDSERPRSGQSGVSSELTEGLVDSPCYALLGLAPRRVCAVAGDKGDCRDGGGRVGASIACDHEGAQFVLVGLVHDAADDFSCERR